LDGGRIDSSYVRRLLPRLAAKAGVDRRVHAHGLRHTYAAELAREGTAINVIRDALGHTSLAVTDRYLRGGRERRSEIRQPPPATRPPSGETPGQCPIRPL